MKLLLLMILVTSWVEACLADRESCRVAASNFSVFENLDKASIKRLRQKSISKAYEKFLKHARELGLKDLVKINSYNIEPVRGMPGIFSARLNRGHRLYFHLPELEEGKAIELVHIGLHDYESFQKKAGSF